MKWQAENLDFKLQCENDSVPSLRMVARYRGILCRVIELRR
jgi:hypothetical protein